MLGNRMPHPTMPSVDPDATREPRLLRTLVLLCVLIATVRLASLALYPLADRTESRYGEIARCMVASGDLITPHIGDEPFWGKPPLSTWCQAGSMCVFGVNEFAARFPGWLITLLTSCLVWRIAWVLGGRVRAWIAATVFWATPLAIGMAGAAMTDPYLVCGTTLALLALVEWGHGARSSADAWRAAVLYGLGLGIATLSKGPLALVLGGAPLLALALTRTGRPLLRAWPWGRSIAAYLIVSVPWFLAAEARTPGFLEYFFVGEHWHRYLDPTWGGDRYGGTHPRPRGAILLYFLVGFATWLPAVFCQWRACRRGEGAGDRQVLDVVLWASVLAPLALFTAAGSVLLTYAFPAIPAACVLLSRPLTRSTPTATTAPAWTIAAFAVVGVIGLFFVPRDKWVHISHEPIVTDLDSEHIVYCRDLKTVYSAIFYSRGRAVAAKDMDETYWDRLRAEPSPYRIVTKLRRFTDDFPDDLEVRAKLEREIDGYYQIWRIE